MKKQLLKFRRRECATCVSLKYRNIVSRFNIDLVQCFIV